jgi:hypothetical protein
MERAIDAPHRVTSKGPATHTADPDQEVITGAIHGP